MVNISKLKLTILQQEMLRFLYHNVGESFTARALSLSLNVSRTAISKALPSLEKNGFILVNKNKATKRLSIQLNADNHLVIGLKRADNLKQIYESGLAQFLYDSLPGATIILFGSYAFGEDTKNSDIDIAVIGCKEKGLDLSEFEETLKKEIIINFYPASDKINKQLLNNILNGITIKGAARI